MSLDSDAFKWQKYPKLFEFHLDFFPKALLPPSFVITSFVHICCLFELLRASPRVSWQYETTDDLPRR